MRWLHAASWLNWPTRISLTENYINISSCNIIPLRSPSAALPIHVLTLNDKKLFGAAQQQTDLQLSCQLITVPSEL